MCDYSLHHVKSRPAKVGDKLTTHNFNTGTCGFAAPEDSTMAVCILPGTELAFSAEVLCAPSGLFRWKTRAINSRTAIFRQINKNAPHVHHDALEFPGWHVCSPDGFRRGSAGDGASASGTTEDASRERGPDAPRLRRLKFVG